MELYQTDYSGDGRFVGTVHADPDPMNEGKWLVPAGAVEIAPPAFDAPSYPVWDGKKWNIITPEIEEEPEQPGPVEEPDMPKTPQIVTSRQAKIALSRKGILAKAEEIINAMEGQAGEEARIEWTSATQFERNHALIVGLGHALELSSDDIDALFVEAALI